MTKEEVIDLIADAGFGLLATAEGPQPRVRPMMPLLSDDGSQLFVALLESSRTIKQISENPQVEVCFVDRKMWFARVTGKAKISENPEKKQFLWDRVPMLRQYFGSPEDSHFKLIEVDIESVEASTPHQKSPEIVDIKE